MKKILLSFGVVLFFSVLIFSCIKPQESGSAKDWKLGVALWTFHDVSFPEQVAKADSCGVEYIEAFAFGKAGAALGDSAIFSLSLAGAQQLKQIVDKSGLHMESIYLVGGPNVDAWKKQFDIAKQLNVKYVTCEPGVTQWDMVDSLAGLYGIKVALHNHWKGTSAYWSPDSVLAAVKNHPNFGACADVGHWPKSGLDAVESLRKLEGHIIALHLKDIAAANNPKLRDVPVGKGIVDFPGIFAELKRQNFNGHLIIERDSLEVPSNVASVIQTVKYCKSEL